MKKHVPNALKSRRMLSFFLSCILLNIATPAFSHSYDPFLNRLLPRPFKPLYNLNVDQALFQYSKFLHKIISQLRCRNDLCLCSKTKDNKKKECWRNLNLNVKMLEIYHHHQCLHEIFVIVSYFCSYVKK